MINVNRSQTDKSFHFRPSINFLLFYFLEKSLFCLLCWSTQVRYLPFPKRKQLKNFFHFSSIKKYWASGKWLWAGVLFWYCFKTFTENWEQNFNNKTENVWNVYENIHFAGRYLRKNWVFFFCFQCKQNFLKFQSKRMKIFKGNKFLACFTKNC